MLCKDTSTIAKSAGLHNPDGPRSLRRCSFHFYMLLRYLLCHISGMLESLNNHDSSTRVGEIDFVTVYCVGAFPMY